MNTLPNAPEPAGIRPDDVFFVIATHKWKLIGCTLLGLIAAAITYWRYIPDYESEAKLLVRYVVDKSAIDSADSQTRPSSTYADSIMANEIEILTSWDLLQAVAERVSPETLSAGGPKLSPTDAVGVIMSGLHVSTSNRSNVITLTYRNRDPEVAKTVLTRLVTDYFEKHLQVHRAAAGIEFVTAQTTIMRGQLRSSEAELKRTKDEAGIVSVEVARKSIEERLASFRSAIDAAEAERAEQQAKIALLTKMQTSSEKAASDAANSTAPRPTEDEFRKYQALADERRALLRARIELAAKYTSESRVVRVNEAQLAEADAALRAMEKKSPGLLASASGRPGRDFQADLVSEQAKLVAIEAKIQTLNSQNQSVLAFSKKFSESEAKITELEQTKNLNQKNYEYFQTGLDKAKLDEALDPSKIPNISVVQAPSPAMKTSRNIRKLLGGMIGGGVALGLALTLVVEFLLDPSVKRASELQTKLGIPLLESVPYVEKSDRYRISTRAGSVAGEETASPLGIGVHLAPYFESVRDRLILFFELNNLFHRPKLVAVTGCTEGVGSSTIAGGLAASLADAGEGKVLLVDMNRAHRDIHPLFEGAPSCTMNEAIRSAGTIAPASDNLYLAMVPEQQASPSEFVPRRFSELVPHLKASVYDFIVFDMPPLNQSCSALAIAGSVDKVLMVAERGRTHREEVQRAYSELVAAGANASCILNKTDETKSLVRKTA